MIDSIQNDGIPFGSEPEAKPRFRVGKSFNHQTVASEDNMIDSVTAAKTLARHWGARHKSG